MPSLMDMAADLARTEAGARVFFGIPDDEQQRVERQQQASDRRRVFGEFLKTEAARVSRKLSPFAQFDDCARWLAQCQCYGTGSHPVIDVFVEAEGGELVGWGQVWHVFGSVMQAAAESRENLLDRR